MKNNINEIRFHDYQLRAMRTMTPKFERVLCPASQQFLHGVLGLAGEIGEVVSSPDDPNTIEEIGDCCWYVAATADSIGIDMEDITIGHEVLENYEQDLQVYVSQLADHAKRCIFYGTEVDPEKVEHLLGRVLVCLNYYASECDATLVHCMDKNIEKLIVRYPIKFSEEQALRRDLKKERDCFED